MRIKNNYSVKEFISLGGSRADISIARVNFRGLTRDEKELEMLEKYYDLLVNTVYLRDKIYEFLVRGRSYREIMDDTGVSWNYVKNLVYRGVRELFNDITEDPYGLVKYDEYVDEDSREVIVDIVLGRLDELLGKYGRRSVGNLEDYLVINLEDYMGDYRYGGVVDEEVLDDAVSRLRYLSEPYLNVLFSRIDNRIVGYIRYLLSTSNKNLSEYDREKKKDICAEWFIPYE